MLYFFIIVVMLLMCFNIYCNNKIYTSETLIESPANSVDINLINWEFFLLDMLKDVQFFEEIVSDSVLLVNITRNNTDRVLQVIKITDILIKVILKNTEKYQVVSMDKMYSAYRELEVSSEEILNSYEFSVRIANYLKADYVIYSIFYENSKNLFLELQLILLKTGEIISVVNKLIG